MKVIETVAQRRLRLQRAWMGTFVMQASPQAAEAHRKAWIEYKESLADYADRALLELGK